MRQKQLFRHLHNMQAHLRGYLTIANILFHEYASWPIVVVQKYIRKFVLFQSCRSRRDAIEDGEYVNRQVGFAKRIVQLVPGKFDITSPAIGPDSAQPVDD